MDSRAFREWTITDRNIGRACMSWSANTADMGTTINPRRSGYKPKYGTLFAQRNWRLGVKEAALRRTQIILTYKKVTTGEVKKYVVAPYSYRYRRLRSGRRKLLFAYDMKSKHIKGFVTRNIRKVAITDRKFRPKWPVEIA